MKYSTKATEKLIKHGFVPSSRDATEKICTITGATILPREGLIRRENGRWVHYSRAGALEAIRLGDGQIPTFEDYERRG